MPQRPLEESTEAQGLQRASLRDGDIWLREGSVQRLQRTGVLAACFLFLLMEIVYVLYIYSLLRWSWLQVAFPAGVFTQCPPGQDVRFHPVLVPLSICRAVGGVVWLADLPTELSLLNVCPLGLAKAAEVSRAGSQCGCLGPLALSVLPSHPASVGAAGGPGPCLSARGLGFYVTGPKLGSQGIKCPCCVIMLSLPMRPAANSSKGCGYFVWEMLQETETRTKKSLFKKRK